MSPITLRLHELNDVRLVGRLTRDPELRFTGKGQAVCRIDLAINRRYKDATGEWKDDTSFIPVVVWRETAQRCSERLKKGSPVYVEGRLRSRNWETKDGQKRTSIEVDTRRIQFLEKSEVSQGSQGARDASPQTEQAQINDEAETASNESVEEEIPF
ncbi:MAG: single-stranded DNA-binding protein [Elusimicrobia bacterium]|nr:single-stranded DNA-binding protein [Elusimicrobiota bacterium]